ncbi:MAG: DUF4913 domain-containing protein [Actinomycetales bacterium]
MVIGGGRAGEHDPFDGGRVPAPDQRRVHAAVTDHRPPVGPALADFVRHVVVGVLVRRIDGRARTWCSQWWEHPDAVLRLEGLRQSWEMCRAEPDLGMSVWLRDHADYHLPILCEVDGPFRGCSPERGHAPRGNPPRWDEPPAR